MYAVIQAKTILLLLLVTVTTLSGQLYAEDPVHFRDSMLKIAIEDKLGVIDPTPTDMLALTSLKHVTDRDSTAARIDDLTGLEYAENLQDLNLRLNEISDLWPLSGLDNLIDLNLSENEITDLSEIGDLPKLQDLNVHANNIENLSPITDLDALRHLDLHENQISDLGPLGEMKHLRSLILYSNEVTDISPLIEIQNLRLLDLRYNNLNDEAYSYYIPVFFSHNPDIDLDYSAYLTSANTSPLRITASKGLYPSKVRISWNGPINGPLYTSRYQVYRSPVNQPASQTRVDDWTYALTVDDITAMPDVSYDYWLEIATESNKSTLAHLNESVSDSGWAGGPHVTVPTHTMYVDDNAPGDLKPFDSSVGDPSEDGSTDHPFDSIQEAIDIASPNTDTTVLVRSGTYYETLNVKGKNLEILGLSPHSQEITPYPVIDPGYADTAIIFTHGEDHDCTLAGFVITRGAGPLASAIACIGSSPTIRNCVIVGNRQQTNYTSAVYCINSNCILENCTITGNRNGGNGAALRMIDCSLVVSNSIIWDNSSNQFIVESGIDPIVSYSTVQGTWLGIGNQAENPQFALPGYWQDLPLENSEWIDGDYHLMSKYGCCKVSCQEWISDTTHSVSVDGGDPSSPTLNESTPNGNRINQGAYGGTKHASRSEE
jgi:hypothetical protein